jgi:putative SOS response-associated peptidase YedK
VINARSEEAAEKPLFRDGMAQRRCLVPAAHYYEWEKNGRQRVKYAIKPANADVTYMAGIYRIEDGVPVFSILTREPASSISFIHDRMPVILTRDMMNDWLNPRYNADEVLRSAVLDVSHTLAGPRQERLI